MSKRILAALSALLVAASTLAVVTAAPASAHTLTKRYCAYDPFAGNQCWTQSVSHTHSDNTPSGRNGDSDGPRNGGTESATPEQRAEAERQRQQAEAERKRKEKADKDDDSGGTDDSGGGDDGGGSDDGGSDDGGGDDGGGSDDGGGDDSGGSDDGGGDDSGGSDDGGGDDSGGGDDGGSDVCPNGQTGTPPNCTEPNKNGKGGGSGGSGQRPTQSAVRAALKTGWSWLSGAVKWVADNNAEVSEAEAKAWEAQSQATKNAAASAAKKVVNGLEAFVKDLGESERQRINADLAAVRSMLQGWQNLNPAAQAAVGGVVCYGAGGAIAVGSGAVATAGGAAFAGGCSALAYGSTKAPLPQLIPEGWTPPSDDDSGTDDDSGGGSGGSSQHQNDPDGDYNGNGKTSPEEAHEASLRYEAEELTRAEYYRIIYKSWCDSGDSYYCGKKPPQ